MEATQRTHARTSATRPELGFFVSAFGLKRRCFVLRSEGIMPGVGALRVAVVRVRSTQKNKQKVNEVKLINRENSDPDDFNLCRVKRVSQFAALNKTPQDA